MKGEMIMATNTFERKIEIRSKKSIDKLAKIISDPNYIKPISVTPYTQADRDRGERALTQFLSHCKK